MVVFACQSPRRAQADLTLALDLAFNESAPLLVVGSSNVVAGLRERGHLVASADSVEEAAGILGWPRHSAIVISPNVPSVLPFIEAIKLPRPDLGGDLVAAARLHADVPVFVLPLDGEAELWVLLHPPDDVFTIDSRRTSIFDLVGRASPPTGS